MLFNQDRHALREMYRLAWQKCLDHKPMTALESQIADIVKEHPEYQPQILQASDRDYLPEDGETNPYMHMSLHLAVRDQIKTNRPDGIRDLFARSCRQFNDQHQAEHFLCEAMGEELWHAQNEARMPDEQRYLRLLNSRLKQK